MIYELDRSRVLKNINVLMHRKNLKVGELEEKAGVSTGLISRMAKEGSTVKMSVDFLGSVASVLGVSIDCLLNYDFEALNMSEALIIDFLETLAGKSRAGEVRWDKFEPDGGQHVSGFSKNRSLRLCGPVYTYALSDTAHAYLVQVIYDGEDEINYELFFSKPDAGNDFWDEAEFICCTIPEFISGEYTELMKNLATSVIEADQHTNLTPGAREAISSFLKR